MQLQSETSAVEQTGQAKAEAQASADTALIKAEAAVKQAELKVRFHSLLSLAPTQLNPIIESNPMQCDAGQGAEDSSRC